MNTPSPYLTLLDIKYPAGTAFDINELVQANEHPWFNQSLCRVNESVVRLGIVQGEYHWHQHENDDEFFFVVSGQLLIDFEDGTVELNPGQAIVVPKGKPHRPRAPQKTVMLMMETAAIVPTGD